MDAGKGRHSTVYPVSCLLALVYLVMFAAICVCDSWFTFSVPRWLGAWLRQVPR